MQSANPPYIIPSSPPSASPSSHTHSPNPQGTSAFSDWSGMRQQGGREQCHHVALKRVQLCCGESTSGGEHWINNRRKQTQKDASDVCVRERLKVDFFLPQQRPKCLQPSFHCEHAQRIPGEKEQEKQPGFLPGPFR